MRNGVGNYSSTTGSRRHSDKKTISQPFLKEFLKRNLLAPNLRKSADKSLLQPWYNHSNIVYASCKRQSYYAHSRGPKQPWHKNYNAICRDWVAKHNRTIHNSVGNCSSKTGSRRHSDKKTILQHFLKERIKRKLLILFTRSSCKEKKNYAPSHGTKQPWRSHYHAICRDRVTKYNRTTRNGKTRWQQSCGHSIAICNNRVKNASNFKHRNNHSVQNTEEGHIRDRNDRSRNDNRSSRSPGTGHAARVLAGCLRW